MSPHRDRLVDRFPSMVHDATAVQAWEPPSEIEEYRLIERIGAGGMGAVYLAHDRLLDRAVAIKFLTSTLSEASRRRFVVEARAAARIHHPNVMAVHRVGEVGEHPYIVSEYVRGKVLSALPLPLPWTRALELGIGLARGLATAHRQGVLHRDIKLANAIIDTTTGEPKLLDFSLAKLEVGGVQHEDDEPAPVAVSPRSGPSPAAGLPGREETLSPLPEPDDGVVDPRPLFESAAQLDRAWHDGVLSLTRADALVGTPLYMAPELWRAEPASRETDVYALGVLLYILCVGEPPYAARSEAELKARVLEQPPAPVGTAAPSIDPRFAAIIDRCLAHVPALRFRSGDALREALEGLRARERHTPAAADNPYRGLRAFEAEHRDLFFGRGAELRAVLDRLRSDAFVLVAGDSGVGKSSLCRAGVCPSVVEGALDPKRRWSYTTMTPGRHPLRALVTALASCLDLEQEGILSIVESRLDSLGWLIHRRLGQAHGRLLFIDQLEELVTLGERDEVEVVGNVLAQLAAGIPGLRLLATVRGDFLTRAAAIPGIGEDMSRAIYLLRPLTANGIREAIVSPAEAMGVQLESSALVDELVTAGLESSLPILQFALAELWEVRDRGSRVITSDDLRGIGGVVGALARHAEGLMASLLPMQRVAAKELLLRLVTIDDTRASLTREELVGTNEDARLALDALVRGRLLVVRDGGDGSVYELAHEALIRGWGNLRRWLDEAAEARERRHRLELGAAEWERLGRPRTALWRAAQIADASVLEQRSLRPRESEFLAASTRAVARGRLARRLAVVAIPAALAATYGLVRWRAQVELDARVDGSLAEAQRGLERARTHTDELRVGQASAFERFDHGADAAGREAWASATTAAEASDRELVGAARELERALTLDPTREDVRHALGDALLARAELAELRRDEGSAAELVERLTLYDPDGERLAQWNAPARLTLETSPAGAAITLVEYQRDDAGRRSATAPRAVGASPLEALELPQGSYLLELSAPDRPPVAYPVLLGRGESLSLSVELPEASAVPAGFAYVPAGRFLLGCSDETLCEVFYNSVPLHPVSTGAFFIARHEVTYGEWIEFLESMPPEQRPALTPRIEESVVAVSLSPLAEGGWELALPRAGDGARARSGQPLTLAAREHRTSQDWLRMPALVITLELANAYVKWLDGSGRVPGARLCTDIEWERAGRGADGRLYPHGDHLDPDDANIDVTYGKRFEAWGPDVVGSHPASRSPFGIDDLAGNAAEWTIDTVHDDAPVLRGGAFFMDAISAHLVGRQPLPPDFVDGSVGMRVCASYPLRNAGA